MTMTIAIVIPARYASTRFPGKPLALIGGQSMLSRVVDVARQAAAEIGGDISVLVATEDARIQEHAERDIGVRCVLTPADCPTGSDRVLAAAEQLPRLPDFLVNLQGDAPFTPPSLIRAVIEAWQEDPSREVVTPVVPLRWDELDRLRESKQTTPFSGTTAIVREDGKALWFSKTILPAMRKESSLRAATGPSPVLQHVGLYGYRSDVLKRFVSLPESPYERLEGLEQLRLLENGISVHAVKVTLEAGLAQAGIDSPEDVVRAEKLLASIA